MKVEGLEVVCPGGDTAVKRFVCFVRGHAWFRCSLENRDPVEVFGYDHVCFRCGAKGIGPS